MNNVKAIPEGYHSVTNMFCVKDAPGFIDFCKNAFGAEEKIRMPGPNNIVMHAELRVGDSTIMVTEAVKDAPTTCAMHIYVNDCDAVWKHAVAAGATENAAPQNMIWGDRFGRVQDKWGNRWAIATHIEDVTAEQVAKRMAEMPKA